MPLFEYKCQKCGLRFEELRNNNEDTDQMPCIGCGGQANKLISTFSSVVSGSSNESVDVKIGKEAEKRWQTIHNRQEKRRKSSDLQTLSLPKSNDGKYMPVMGLGGKEDRTKRTEYVGALQEHRKKRKEKGLPQFSGPGPF